MHASAAVPACRSERQSANLNLNARSRYEHHDGIIPGGMIIMPRQLAEFLGTESPRSLRPFMCRSDGHWQVRVSTSTSQGLHKLGLVASAVLRLPSCTSRFTMCLNLAGSQVGALIRMPVLLLSQQRRLGGRLDY